MTAKEALKILSGDFSNVTLRDGESYADVYAEAFKMACEALEKADKYRWHDLRKNPNDLPKEDGEYYAYQYCNYCITADPDSEVCEPMYTIIFVKDGKINDCYEGGKIIAWKEIEPFEVKV